MAALKMNGEKIEFWDMFPVGTSTVIAPGDMCYWDTSTSAVLPASSFTWTTDAATTRRAFKRFYVGVAAEAHFASGPNTMVKILQSGKFTCTTASNAGAPGVLVGPDSASNLLLNQQLINVVDPTEAIGEYARYYSSAVTEAEVYLNGVYEHYSRTPFNKRVLHIAAPAFPANTAKWVNAAPAWKFFGGAAEILAVGFITQVALGTNDLVVAVKNGSTALATDLTSPTSGSAAGDFVRQATASSDAARLFGANDTITIITNATAPTSGSGTLFIEYRPLS